MMKDDKILGGIFFHLVEMDRFCAGSCGTMSFVRNEFPYFMFQQYGWIGRCCSGHGGIWC